LLTDHLKPKRPELWDGKTAQRVVDSIKRGLAELKYR
jgi:hypothetical protein